MSALEQMPWIQNVSFLDIQEGYHYYPDLRCVLIQIVDPDMDFPKPLYKFTEIHQFKFDDADEDTWAAPNDSITLISDQHAKAIANILLRAIESRSNVVVHCVAGICRSGAVCEVGTMLGFRDAGGYRLPNILVKKKLMKALELSIY